MRQFILEKNPDKKGLVFIEGKDFRYLRQVLRAKVGDIVIATGFYGTSRAGFEILEHEEKFADEFPDFILEKFCSVIKKAWKISTFIIGIIVIVISIS